MVFDKFLKGTQNVEDQNLRHLGKTAGIIWQHANGIVTCLVQIDRHNDHAEVTVFDATSVTMNFASIVTGVFLEHLANTYQPDQITFFHRTALAEDLVTQFGVRPIMLDWSQNKGEFMNPRLGKWTPDNQLTKEEIDFIFSLSLGARVGVEAFMREEFTAVRSLTPRMEEIYNEYKNRIAANGGSDKFNIRLKSKVDS